MKRIPQIFLYLGAVLVPQLAIAQECLISANTVGGGYVNISGSQLGADPQLSIDIGPDLSYVHLESSELFVEISAYDVLAPDGSVEYVNAAIRSWVIKSVGQDQLGNSPYDYIAASGGAEQIIDAQIINDTAQEKTVRITWRVFDSATQLPHPTRTLVKDFTIFANQSYLKVDFVDVQYAINFYDVFRPGGSFNGVHLAHGGDQAPRGYITHQEPNGSFYNRYPPDQIFDPVDGGPLNYNGHFVLATYLPANGRGIGRTLPVSVTDIIKLLHLPTERRGVEVFNRPFLQPIPSFTGYIYSITQGESDALATGRALIDGSGVGSAECGSERTVTASAYSNWTFDGWSGDIVDTQNPLVFTPTDNVSLTATFTQDAGLLFEDFEGFSAGQEPPAWLDTGASNSLVEDDSLFAIGADTQGSYLNTDSALSNIHSHLGSDYGSAYELSGRMRGTAPNSAFGVTAFSDYPNSDSYYRFRRYDNQPFELSPHGTAFTSGTTQTALVAAPNQWYRFRLQVEDVGAQTEVRAKVWADGDVEPAGWQVEAVDASATRLSSGKVGVWTHSVGSKHFDELAVFDLGSNPPTTPITTSAVGNGTVVLQPDQPLYVPGSSVQLTANPDSGWAFQNWSGDVSDTANPLTVVVGSTPLNISATFEEAVITQHPITLQTIGAGSVSLNPDQPLYDLGSVVTATAIPDADWAFSGWSGDIVSSSNPLDIQVPGDLNLTATFVDVTGIQDFENAAIGADPVGWVDTAPNNSLAIDDSLFKVASEGNQFLATASTATNVHSHYTGVDAPAGGYRYTGRMRMTDADGGMGVTFFSQFPDAPAYYRLRRYFDNDFHISPLGTSVTGNAFTGVTPVENQWYRFSVEVEDDGARTNVRANVWPDGSAEPGSWQVEVFDDSSTRLTSGTIGVWGFFDGGKHYDDLQVTALGPRPDVSLTLNASGPGTVSVTPDQPSYPFGTSVSVTATADSGAVFSGWSGDFGGAENPLNIQLNTNATLTGNFFDPSTAFLENFESYANGSDPVDWLDTAPENSLSPDNNHEVVEEGGGNSAFRTTSVERNLHSHFTGALPSGSGYEFAGRMRMTTADAGIGVTFFSSFPGDVRYYRLRRYFDRDFRISPNGTGISGAVATGVVPVPNQWYRFKVQVQDVGSRTEIRAKVWIDGAAEPAGWQADAFDDSATRLTSGTIGTWSFHTGQKLWDDFTVTPLN